MNPCNVSFDIIWPRIWINLVAKLFANPTLFGLT